MTPDTLYRDAAHPAARHGQRRLATSQLRRRASGERRSGGWWLRAEHSAFIPTVVLVVGTLAVLVTLPYGSWRIPGARRVQAVLDHIPQPWKPPRPEYVPAPAEGSAVITTVSNAAAGAAPPVEAPPAATPAARATTPGGSESPAVPIAATMASLPAAVNPAPPAVRLQNFRHQYQTWNNCGPATITMATSHFGRAETQAQAAPVLKPNPNDKNVGPDELVA
ncbi:MAG TPA: hypothetical protein VHS99_07385, partial [Chloroflexota bacterium]|nr:hypothetical protein [Chloroflexota bacterium]